MMRNLTGQEDLTYFRGFVYRSPLLVIAFACFLLSLLGMPPLAGFTAKFQIFSVLYDAATRSTRDRWPLKWTMFAYWSAGGINTVISLFYYVKVLKVMVLEKRWKKSEDRPTRRSQRRSCKPFTSASWPPRCWAWAFSGIRLPRPVRTGHR